MKRIYLPFLMLLLLVVNCKEASNAEVKLVTAEEMQELTEIEDVQLVDVRTPSEFEEGFIANAQNIDYNSPYFEKEIAKLDKSKPVLVYCEKGGRSAKCVDKMKDAGFVKIYDLQGGMAKWKFKGFEVKTLH